MNRGWIDRSARRLPTYKEITSSRNGKGRVTEDSDEEEDGGSIDERSEDGHAEHPSLDEDEFDDVADHFESSYNFRFEEP